MKKASITILSIFLFVFISIKGIQAQKIGEYECKWHVPGSSPDDEGLINQMRFDEKSQFLFLISNDEKNIYFDIVMADHAAIQKVMRFGLTTWINPEGKHKKRMGVQFPAAPEEGAEPSFRHDKGGDRKDMMFAIMDRKNQEMVLLGFGEKGEQKVIDPRIDPDFQGRVKMMEGGNMSVSLVIPVNQLGMKGENIDMLVSVGFETGYLDLTRQGGGMPAGGGQDNRGGEMHGGGPPGSSQGDMGGNNSQQQRPEISEMASPNKLWISKVWLAKKP